MQYIVWLGVLATILTASHTWAQGVAPAEIADEVGASIQLPEPFATQSAVHMPRIAGWKEGEHPTAPEGFQVTSFARDIENPRWIKVLSNGDVLVAQARTLPKKKPEPKTAAEAEKQKKIDEGMRKSRTVTGDSPNQITLLRDTDGDGVAETRHDYAEGLRQPFGIELIGETLYIACTDGVLTYDYDPEATHLDGPGKKIVDLPAGGYNNHWTRNLLASRDGKKLYIAVGSGSNVGENGMANEVRRANILEVNPDGSGERVFAAGLRNPVGMAWAPGTDTLWTVVNERDELGDELVPDYMTSVQQDGFYGWPYSYHGQHEDPRRKGEKPELVAKAITPDLALGCHTASLGLAFYEADQFPDKYRGGAFVGQRGSWNRSQLAGYQVMFVPFKDGKVSGTPEPFLTGFVVEDPLVHGRPVGVAVAKSGALLVADEPGNTVWCVTHDE